MQRQITGCAANVKKGGKERMIINSVVFAVLVLESVADIKMKSISLITC